MAKPAKKNPSVPKAKAAPKPKQRPAKRGKTYMT